MGITNSLSKFFLMEDDQLLGFERVSPKVLVDMVVAEVFPVELKVIWEGGFFYQENQLLAYTFLVPSLS